MRRYRLITRVKAHIKIFEQFWVFDFAAELPRSRSESSGLGLSSTNFTYVYHFTLSNSSMKVLVLVLCELYFVFSPVSWLLSLPCGSALDSCQKCFRMKDVCCIKGAHKTLINAITIAHYLLQSHGSQDTSVTRPNPNSITCSFVFVVLM